MRRWTCAVTVLAGLALASSAAAQAKADFSGQWTAEPEATAPARSGGAGANTGRAPDLGSGWKSPITIAQDASRLTVEYAHFGRGDLQPSLRFVYALDGAETKNRVMMGRGIQEQTARTSWENEKLVITTVHTFPDPNGSGELATEVRRTLSLESPARLVIETMRAGVLGGPSSTTRTVYTKS